ncbi:hypothetical protein [Flindersiella endophytica]
MAPILPDRAVRTIRIGIPALVAIVLAAGVIGGVIGAYVPFGAKSPMVERGVASMTPSGSGTFQADHGGASAYLPPEVAWTDGSGTQHLGDRPPCLATRGDEAVSAKVEAAYIEARDPEGGSYLIATWVRCL